MDRIIITINRIIVTVLCLVLCLAGIAVPVASAASRLSTSSKTALSACLQQEYLMRDTYQTIFAMYPALTSFDTVAKNESTMITSLAKIFSKYKIATPADTQISAARALAQTATSALTADAVAISLEQSTAVLMTQLFSSADNQDVQSAIALVRTTSLGAHITAFSTEQATVTAPVPAPTPAPTPAPEPTPAPAPQQNIVSFTTADSTSKFLTLLADETVDVIEMAAGTYHLRYSIINIDRTRPVLVRPAAGATVVLSGSDIGGDPQFWFGLNGKAGNIAMTGLIFDGFILAQQGIIQARDVHDISLNNMVVRNSRCNGTTAKPYHSWAIYLDATSTIVPTNFTANNWTVDGSNGQMGALQVFGGNGVTTNGWVVSGVCFAVYASGTRGPLSNFTLDGWTISGSGMPDWGSPNVSVAMEYAAGRFSNMHATTSGVLLNVGNPRMTDGGGNSF